VLGAMDERFVSHFGSFADCKSLRWTTAGSIAENFEHRFYFRRLWSGNNSVSGHLAQSWQTTAGYHRLFVVVATKTAAHSETSTDARYHIVIEPKNIKY
jgi:hypothetical protein